MTKHAVKPAAAPAAAFSPVGPNARAALVLSDGTAFEGRAFGADRQAVGEVCFNTAMTGYQEILSDPSYAGQIVCFTFPHIGIVGTNPEDIEAVNPAVRGLVVRADVAHPSNWRSIAPLDRWLKTHNIPAIAGIDTRALAARIRQKGMPHGVIAHGDVDVAALARKAKAFSGLEGLDLARDVTSRQTSKWRQTPWKLGQGYGEQSSPEFRVVVIDYGAKHNILRELAGVGADVTVAPATARLADILKHRPQGVVLSNGPGDPAATGEYAIPVIRDLIEADIAVFGICLGHQMLGLALGATTKKMSQGHHGANHPVKDLESGKVEIVSMNHGFTVDGDSLPRSVKQTHVSLFDGTNCGLRLEGRDVFGVQYHPEASPGPMDSHYLFERFAAAAKKRA
ncbi:MAG TPA: glutamine-hydrolyzing carbamoyl-phosphate synthase small subunit [Rhizomicrobium sp.]|nr:glutamine-hydrolyzing carbamoyl-phosphate synthase small subunit [Rhizomicrobium sp.]